MPHFAYGKRAALTVLGAAMYSSALFGADPIAVTPQKMKRIGTVDERFQDALPAMIGSPVSAGQVKLPTASITFLAFPNARNASCR